LRRAIAAFSRTFANPFIPRTHSPVFPLLSPPQVFTYKSSTRRRGGSR
jgi:hypothetical protein